MDPRETAVQESHRVLKSVSKLVFGSGAAQGLQLIALPFLGRLYSAEQLGLYFSVVAAAAIVTVVVTLQLQHAIPSLKLATDVAETIALCAILISIMTLLAVLVYIMPFGQEGAYIFWVLVISASLSVANLTKALLIRLGRFASISIMQFVRAIVIVIIQITSMVAFEVNGLLIGIATGELVAAGVMLIFGLRTKIPRIRAGFFQRAIKKNKQFVLTGTVQELTAVAALSLPLLTIPMVFNEENAGQFGMAQRLIWPPAVIVLSALVSVFYYRFGRAARFEILQYRITHPAYLMLLALATSAAAYFVVPVLASMLLNDNWTGSVWASKYLATWACFLVFSAPYRSACRMYNLQKVQLSVDFGMLLSIVFLSWLSFEVGLLFSTFVVILSFLGVAQNMALGIVVHRKYKSSEVKNV